MFERFVGNVGVNTITSVYILRIIRFLLCGGTLILFRSKKTFKLPTFLFHEYGQKTQLTPCQRGSGSRFHGCGWLRPWMVKQSQRTHSAITNSAQQGQPDCVQSSFLAIVILLQADKVSRGVREERGTSKTYYKGGILLFMNEERMGPSTLSFATYCTSICLTFSSVSMLIDRLGPSFTLSPTTC